MKQTEGQTDGETETLKQIDKKRGRQSEADRLANRETETMKQTD